MTDYTPFVIAVYAIAVMVYGGGALYWQQRLQHNLRVLAESGETSHGAS